MPDQGCSRRFFKGDRRVKLWRNREYSLFRDLNVVGYLLQIGFKGRSRHGQPRTSLVKPLVTCDPEGYNTKSAIHLKSMQTVSGICECT